MQGFFSPSLADPRFGWEVFFWDKDKHVSICYGDLFVQWTRSLLFSAKAKVPVDISLKQSSIICYFFLPKSVTKKSARLTSLTNSFLRLPIHFLPDEERGQVTPPPPSVHWPQGPRRGSKGWRSGRRPKPYPRRGWTPRGRRRGPWPRPDPPETRRPLPPPCWR